MSSGKLASTLGLQRRTLRALLAVAGAALVALFAIVGSPEASGTFSPTVDFQTSTTRAGAHPDAQVTIDNSASSESLKSLSISLPDGFWGSLAAATKCSATATDVANANVNCTDASKVGTVTNVAEIDQSTVRLRGNVYLADAAAAGAQAGAEDPASILIVLHPKVGAVVFKDVVLAARAQVRYGATSPVGATGVVGPVQGITTTVDNIPTQVDDDDGHYSPVSFKLDTVTLDLYSHVENVGSTPPLLTNASKCTTSNFAWSATSYDSSNSSDTIPYTTTDCGTVKFDPTFSSSFTVPNAGADTGLTTTISLPADNGSGNGTFNGVRVVFPPSIGANFTAFGAAADQCPSSAAATTTSSFQVWRCPTQARVGSVTLNSPLYPTPLEGDVYLINKSPLPWLGIDVRNSVDHPDNPVGVTVDLVGSTSTPQLVSACDQGTESGGFCQATVAANFANLPDAPVSSMTLDLSGISRTGVGNVSLPGETLHLISAGDPTCDPIADTAATFTGTSNSAGSAVVSKLATQSISGCGFTGPTEATGPFGAETSSQTPTFTFGGASASGSCAVDAPWTGMDAWSSLAGNCAAGSFTAPSSLSKGVHRVFLGNDTGTLDRAFVVHPSGSDSTNQDSSGPSTTIDSGPADSGTTTSTAPQFAFTSDDGSATFTCSVDDSAFLPCTSPYTTPDLTTGADHTFEVRATDTSGNPDLTAAKRTFTVAVPFDPQITVTPSTTVARAHPSLDVTVDNASAENIKDLKISMPDGFFGGLTGVTQVCTVAQATTTPDGNGSFPAPQCPAASQIGTVSTHGVVLSDDGVTPSDAVLDGKVYLTDGFSAGEPAGLLISVHAQISTVDLGYINVPVRLAVREHALGIDTLGFDLPKSITSVDGTTNFQLRHLSMHIDTGAGASQPLLTNPSQCEPQSFSASFTGYSSSTSSDSAPFNVSGCSSLGFAPALSLTMLNNAGGAPGASNNSYVVGVNLAATLSSDPNGAGIASADLTMPPGLTIDPAHIPVACTIQQQSLDACPAASAIGTATALTPLLSGPLNGTVYVLERDPNSNAQLPRVLVALRGAINTDIVATNQFENALTRPQIVTKFSVLPDAPITSFAMTVGNSFLTTRDNACTFGPDDWNITGIISGYNGAQSGVNSAQKFDCPNANAPTASYKLKKKGKKTTLVTSVTAQGSKSIKKVTLKLPKGLSFNKKAFTKKKIAKMVTVTANGSKLKTKCFKKKSSSTFEVNLCGKSVGDVKITFKKGSLIATKKLSKKPKFSTKVKDSDGRTKSALLVKS